MAGIFGNIALLILAFFGTILVRYKSTIGTFVLVFTSIAIIPLYFGDKIILSRVMYDIPLQIPIGWAMTNIYLSREGKLEVSCIDSSTPSS